MTLGCRTNQYESQAYADQLQALGYKKAEEHERVDVCIVNTCTVTDTADHSSHKSVAQLRSEYPNAEIIVTGCAVEKSPKSFGSFEKLHVIANKDKESLLPLVFPEEEWPEFAIKQFEAHTRAFVKVQDGCNSFCTYCIIPYVRGRSRSRKLAEIVKEVEGLIANGFQEIVLTGINIGDYDGAVEEGEKPVRLAELVRTVDAIPGVKRLRISSIDPDEVDDELMDAVLQGKATCPSFHLVLQSGSNTVLKRMNRKYTVQIFLETVAKLKKARPDFTFTTDVIVGFPGETEADFEETVSLIRSVSFAKVHMFPYSKRERTRAALYPNQVPGDVMQRRKRHLLVVAEETAFCLREEHIGKEVSVLLENKEKEGSFFFGHSESFLPVLVEGADLTPNQIVTVKLIKNTPEALIGELLCQ